MLRLTFVRDENIVSAIPAPLVILIILVSVTQHIARKKQDERVFLKLWRMFRRGAILSMKLSYTGRRAG